MDEASGWREMATAPKDGTRILVTVRNSEQGPAEVDVAHWARADQFGIEQLIVGSMIGHKALGLWTAGWAFETATVLPGNLLAGFVAPVVASADPSQKKKMIWKWTTISLVSALLICGVLNLLMDWLLPFVFGPDAQAAVTVAKILVLAGVFLGWRRVLGVSLQALGVPGLSTWAELACFLSMVAGVLSLGMTHGLEGAAWGMVIGGVVGSVLQVVMISKTKVIELSESDPVTQVG